MSKLNPNAEHFAQPTPVNDPANPFKLVKPVCRTCGKPVERRNKNAAPGAWRHVR